MLIGNSCACGECTKVKQSSFAGFSRLLICWKTLVFPKKNSSKYFWSWNSFTELLWDNCWKHEKFEPYSYFHCILVALVWKIFHIAKSGWWLISSAPGTQWGEREWRGPVETEGSLEMSDLSDRWLNLNLAVEISSWEGILVIYRCITNYLQNYQLTRVNILYCIVSVGQ